MGNNQLKCCNPCQDGEPQDLIVNPGSLKNAENSIKRRIIIPRDSKELMSEQVPYDSYKESTGMLQAGSQIISSMGDKKLRDGDVKENETKNNMGVKSYKYIVGSLDEEEIDVSDNSEIEGAALATPREGLALKFSFQNEVLD